MPKVTDILGQKKSKDRFSVFLDGKYSFSLSGQDVLDQKVRKGLEVTDGDLARYEKLSQDSLVLARTYAKCMTRPHSVREIRDYLRKKFVDPDLIESVIEKCIDKKAIDDDYFTDRWVEMRLRGNRSKQRIRQELKSKGITDEIINKYLNSEVDDSSALRAAIDKKQRRYVDDEKKLIAYLQRQGFSYHDIREELTNRED